MSQASKHRSRAVNCPSELYRLFGGAVNFLVMAHMKDYQWSTCGKSADEIDS